MSIRTLLSRAGATLAGSAATIALWSSVGLAASLGANVWLVGKVGQAKGVAAGEIAAAVERGRADALAERADQMTRLAMLAEQGRADLVADLEGIAERGRQSRVVYRDRIASLPAASCAPGQERMNAVNELVAGE